MKRGSLAGELKTEARANEGGEPTFVTINGWKFGLSFGETREPSREEYDRFFADILRRMNIDEAAPTYEEFLVSLKTRDDVAVFAKQWVFSASLHPMGRNSKEADWKFLGKMVAALGAPEGSLMTPFETTSPNTVHYWIWYEAATTGRA